jgi:hypothetical protein
VTALEKAPTILTRAGAEKLAARIRRNLAAADDDLLRAWEGCAWEPLGLESFAEFCELATAGLEFVRLSVPARLERTLVLVQGGASIRDAAAASGVSPATTHADVQRLVRDGRLQRPERVRGADGILRPATPLRAATPQTNVDRCGLTLLMHEAWQRVDRAGDDGITCPELERVARWRHGRTSSLLHRLERAGHVYRTGETREQYGTLHSVYRARPLAVQS